MLHYLILIIMITSIPIDGCSDLRSCAMQTKVRAIDRIGYWKTKWTSEPGSYTYTHDMPSHRDTDTRIMSFNIQRVDHATRRWYHLFSGGNPWFAPHRFWRIIDIIKHFTPDIMCLQEVNNAMLSGILNSIATRYQVAQTHETSYEATLTNPIIYDTNRYNVRKLAFYGGKDKDDNLITYADFNHNVTGQPLTCMNIHGGAGEELYNTLNARIQEAYRPCYIAGDFNAYIQHLDENLHDMELAYSGGTNTYIPWTAKTPNAGAPIDTILYTPSAPVKNTANNVAVFNGEVKDGHMQHNHRPSDHRPVISNFTPHKQ